MPILMNSKHIKKMLVKLWAADANISCSDWPIPILRLAKQCMFQVIITLTPDALNTPFPDLDAHKEIPYSTLEFV